MQIRNARERLTLAAACTPAAAYLLYVWHYAVNAPFADDWSRTPLVGAALHGHLTFGQVWTQYSEARLVVSNLLLVGFGFVDHMNLRAVVVFSAVVYAATYFLMLIAYSAYLRRPLTFLPVFSLGIVWFSLVGATNALWAFQLAWYVALLFLFAVIHLLFVWPHNRKVAIALAILAAVGGSLSMLQGFLLWPIGLICLLWVWTREHKRPAEVAVWLTSGLFTTLFYLRGYKLGVGCIGPAKNCSPTANASHPGHLATYYLGLVGRVVGIATHWDLVYVQFLGAAIILGAGFVIVRSCQARDPTRLPLPLLMIVFALLFDLTISLGRAGERNAAGLQDRYTMPNVILLAGLVAFAWAHAPDLRAVRHNRDRGYRGAVVAFIALGILVLGQGILTTPYGLRKARYLRTHQVHDARTVVNLGRIPRAQRGCYVSKYVWNSTYGPGQALVQLRLPLARAKRDHLMIFEHGAFDKYRAEGPPPPPACA